MVGRLLGETAKKWEKLWGTAQTALATGDRICHSYKCADEISKESGRRVRPRARAKAVSVSSDRGNSKASWKQRRSTHEVPLTSRLAVARGGSRSRPEGSRSEPPTSKTGLMKRVFSSCFREQTHGCNPLLCERAKDKGGTAGRAKTRWDWERSS